MSYDPRDINRPKPRPTADQLANQVDDATQIKRAFKGVAGGKPANASVLLGRRLRRQRRQARKAGK